MQETWVRSLGREDPLEKEMVTHSSILAWEMSWTEEHWWATVYGVAEESDMISVQFSSVVQSCLTPHGLSTPGLSVYLQLPELAQTHVHQVSKAILSSHPLLSPSPPALNLSQHQSLFQ